MSRFAAERAIFKAGSTTYFNATRFFPRAVQEDVAKLYSFVRIADNYVDQVPQDLNGFGELVRAWRYYKNLPMPQLKHVEHDTLNVRVAKNICQLVHTYHFDVEWVEAFLESMYMDTRPTTYRTLDDTLAYIYGSAEVIGLMMAKILGVSSQGYEAAMLQGRAMQYINFLRDINEDLKLGRRYFADEELAKFGLAAIDEQTARAHPDAFRAFMRAQLAYYAEWQKGANEGLHFLPRRARVAIRTAVDGYDWTAERIAEDPFIVFERQVKPSRRQLIISGVGHIFD